MDWGSLYRRSIFTTSYPQKGSQVYPDEPGWSGKRGKALCSMLAVLAQDPDTGLIDYGNADILQKDESAVVLEFLDFYHGGTAKKNNKLRYIVFDSRFTNYETLRKLDQAEINFITISRRGKKILE